MQTFFNFGSLQAYDILLVLTAILLARRRVWYDASLQAFLERGFLLVPFILGSQDAHLSGPITALICASGVLLAFGRFLALQVFFPNLNLPGRPLSFGVLLVFINLTMPIEFNNEHLPRPGSTEELSFRGWMWVLPSRALFVNLLPRPKHQDGNTPAFSLCSTWPSLACCFCVIANIDSHAGSSGFRERRRSQRSPRRSPISFFPITIAPRPPQDPSRHPPRPSALYNSMIAPLQPCTFRGAIWYQGESSAVERINIPVVNLYNKEGLPASPFRSDDFPITTPPRYIPRLRLDSRPHFAYPFRRDGR